MCNDLNSLVFTLPAQFRIPVKTACNTSLFAFFFFFRCGLSCQRSVRGLFTFLGGSTSWLNSIVPEFRESPKQVPGYVGVGSASCQFEYDAVGAAHSSIPWQWPRNVFNVHGSHSIQNLQLSAGRTIFRCGPQFAHPWRSRSTCNRGWCVLLHQD